MKVNYYKKIWWSKDILQGSCPCVPPSKFFSICGGVDVFTSAIMFKACDVKTSLCLPCLTSVFIPIGRDVKNNGLFACWWQAVVEMFKQKRSRHGMSELTRLI